MNRAYLEYLELFDYFVRGGAPRLGRAEFEALDAEFAALVARLAELDAAERAWLRELKDLLLRDKP